MKQLTILFSMIFVLNINAQTWVDSMDNFARIGALPPVNYTWTWQNAPLLHAMEYQYENSPVEEREKYLSYVRRAMNSNLLLANGSIYPNFVASGHGMAFLARITNEQIYKDIAKRIYRDYNTILRTSNGGVSHLPYAGELWDDTIYMIGIYLLQMYKAFGDDLYLDDLIEQIKIHKQELQDPATGFWVHGWDDDNQPAFDFCSQLEWADPITRRSEELWGRGNGWIIVMLSEILKTIDDTHPEWNFLSTSLIEMIDDLPNLQNQTTGHWYQLPYRANEADNFEESSCTAMFGYGIITALELGLISGSQYDDALHLAYSGLKTYSTKPVPNNPAFYNTKNVAKETCIGDKNYYFDIAVGGGKVYSFAVFVIFGRAYEAKYLSDVATNVSSNSIDKTSLTIYPSIVDGNSSLQLSFSAVEHFNGTIEVVDVLGRTISKQYEAFNVGQNQSTILINDISNGQYFVRLVKDSGELIGTSAFVTN